MKSYSDLFSSSALLAWGARFLMAVGLLVGSLADAQSLFERLEGRSPSPTGHHLTALRVAGGRLVAVGDRSTLVSSANGTEWVVHPGSSDRTIADVAFGNGVWVVVGADSARLSLSTDLAQWEFIRPANISFNNSCVLFHDGTFYLGGIGQVSTSTDGRNWTAIDLPTEEWISNLTHAGGLFFATGWNAMLLTSPDGQTWTPRNPGFTAEESKPALYHARHLNGRYLVGGSNGVVLSSSDAVTWTRHLTGNSNDWIYDLEWRDGAYYAIGHLGNLRRSTDLVDWTNVSTGMTEGLAGLAWFQSRLYVAGRNGHLASSADLATWTSHRTGQEHNHSAVAFGAGKFVAATYNGRLRSSVDGLAWTTAFEPAGAPIWNDVIFADGRFVALASDNRISQSLDGVTWSQPQEMFDAPNFQEAARLQHLNGQWFAFGNNGLLRRSANLAQWETHDQTEGSPTFTHMTHGNGLYVVVGWGGVIYTSADGATWTRRESGVTQDLRAVVHAKDTFVTAGANNTALTSRDGLTWTAEGQQGVPFHVWGLLERDGLFVAMATFGELALSPDGLRWTSVRTPAAVGIVGFAEGNGQLIGVGFQGTIVGAALPARHGVQVTTEGPGGVTRHPEQADYEEGSELTLTAAPSADHAFSHWSGGTSGAANPLTLTVTGPLAITAHFVPALAGYDLWTLNHFTADERANAAVSDPAADPDGDGLVNLQEYFHGALPKTPELPPFSHRVVVLNNASWPVVSYPRVVGIGDVTEVIEVSTDLQTWSATTGAGTPWAQLYNLEETGPNRETVAWRITQALGTGPAVFVRLKLVK